MDASGAPQSQPVATTDWSEFDRLQREAANSPELRWRRLVPKGVYRFKTHEEANAWEEAWKRKAAELEHRPKGG